MDGEREVDLNVPRQNVQKTHIGDEDKGRDENKVQIKKVYPGSVTIFRHPKN